MLHEIYEILKYQYNIPYIILAVTIVGMIIILERFIILQFIYRINFPQFNKAMRKFLDSRDFNHAKSYCFSTSKTGLPMIAVRAIETHEDNADRIKGYMSEAALDFIPRIRKRINQLPNLAAVCIMLGALGTIEGMWVSFQSAEILEFGVKSLAFSRGVSESLIPLIFSLICAVVLIIPYGILDSIAYRLEGEIEHSLCVLNNILAPEAIYALANPKSTDDDNTDENKLLEEQSEMQSNARGEPIEHQPSKDDSEKNERKLTDIKKNIQSELSTDEEEII
jgi:biopolymer transport protein ExbB/TolQ